MDDEMSNVKTQRSKLTILIPIILLTLLISFNFWLYKSEFKVLSDPNDNIFQYALVGEAKNIWQQIFSGKLFPFYLLDSWQERWAEGFALSNYYAHLPQAAISLIGLMSPIGMFKTFVVIRTLMLIFLPLMFFWGGRILRLPLLLCYLVALFSQAIFTDGLYGIDVSSFMWRGWGLSAQLTALFFLPQAFGYAVRYLDEDRRDKGNWRLLGKAVFFNFLVAQAHFGIFSLLLLGYPLIFLASLRDWGDWGDLGRLGKRLAVFIVVTLFSLSYFIVPFFLQSQYRNFSIWDPIWKFDSWGARQIIVWFLNGDLFDFNRFPWITLAVGFGVLGGLGRLGKLGKENRTTSFLAVLYFFYTVLFFGRTTLGKLIDLVPGFSEYHLHRIIVMVQFTGILLGAWFLYEIIINFQFLIINFYSIFNDLILKRLKIKNLDLNKNLKFQIINLIYLALFLVGIVIIYKLELPLINYAKDNNAWIERSNKSYLADLPAYEKIKTKLASLPRARVYAGKPGNWGRQFYVGETPVYMALSRDGFAVIGFLPESWSPNSDPEQFFDESYIESYNLYNVGYSLLPDTEKSPKFAKLLLKEGKYSLYQVKTEGWFNFGESNIAVKTKKTNLLNLTRIWFSSKLLNRDYPTIDLSGGEPDGKKWYIQMVDLNHFINLNDGKERNLWQANPFGDFKKEQIQVKNKKIKEEIFASGYKVQFSLDKDCQNCTVVLKQSFHPNWQVKVNGQKAEIFPVFPFYIGIPIEKAGDYEIVAEYKPGGLKVGLVWVEIGGFGILGILGRLGKLERLGRR